MKYFFQEVSGHNLILGGRIAELPLDSSPGYQDRNPAQQVSIARIVSTEMALRVIRECIQLHGGYGYASEYGIERACRDARLATIGGGATEVMKEIVGRTMGL